MAFKEGAFKVRLFVDEEQVAESEDIALWQSVFSAISRTDGMVSIVSDQGDMLRGRQIGGDSVAKLAETLGVDKNTIRGACDPQKEEPYIHLDMRCWSAWTKNTPPRGKNSISSTILAATLLCLWFRDTGLGNPDLRMCHKVLSGIGVEGKNPTRSVKNCSWLQLRGGQTIQLNPAEIEKAIEVARAFCEKRSLKTKSP